MPWSKGKGWEGPKTQRRIRREPEFVEHAAVMHWVYLHEEKYPDLKRVYTVPNSGVKSWALAKKFRAMGVRSGPPDLHLDKPRRGYHGLRIEMKAPGKLSDTSDKQDEWIAELVADGFCVAICDRWQDAVNILIWYLDLPAAWQQGGRILNYSAAYRATVKATDG